LTWNSQLACGPLSILPRAVHRRSWPYRWHRADLPERRRGRSYDSDTPEPAGSCRGDDRHWAGRASADRLALPQEAPAGPGRAYRTVSSCRGTVPICTPE